jgi:hypothetical protein
MRIDFLKFFHVRCFSKTLIAIFLFALGGEQIKIDTGTTLVASECDDDGGSLFCMSE